MSRFPRFLLLAALLCVHSSYGRSLQEPLNEIGPFMSGVHAKNNPVYCQGKYDATLLHGTLRNELNQKWPNLRGGPNDKFWKHEFEKHGMCPFDSSVFRPQEEYFRHAVDLYDEYNIKAILHSGGVVPSSNDLYTLSQITAALHSGLGVHPAVYCYQVHGIQFLLEVRMCFDLSYRPITCGDSLVGGGRCDPNKDVIYSPTEIKVTHDFPRTHYDDLAFQFLLDVAKMGEKEMTMDEEEENDGEGLWENHMKYNNQHDHHDNDHGLDVAEHQLCFSSKITKKSW